MYGLLGNQTPQTRNIAGLNVANKTLSGLLSDPQVSNVSILDALGTAQAQRPQSFLGRMGNTASAIGSNLLTGPGSSERLQALGASLLAGPSATPISFGQSLSKGLLAGKKMAKEAEQQALLNEIAKRKMEILEEQLDIDRTKASVSGRGSSKTMYKPDGTSVNVYEIKSAAGNYFVDTSTNEVLSPDVAAGLQGTKPEAPTVTKIKGRAYQKLIDNKPLSETEQSLIDADEADKFKKVLFRNAAKKIRRAVEDGVLKQGFSLQDVKKANILDDPEFREYSGDADLFKELMLAIATKEDK